MKYTFKIEPKYYLCIDENSDHYNEILKSYPGIPYFKDDKLMVQVCGAKPQKDGLNFITTIESNSLRHLTKSEILMYKLAGLIL